MEKMDSQTIDNEISMVLSINPCFGVVHYDSESCDCYHREVFIISKIISYLKKK